MLSLALVLFGYLNPSFSFLHDFISKLGAMGEPNALGFNLLGFVVVGILLFLFGWHYGRYLEDRILAYLLSFFGLGFAFTAIPIDMNLDRSPVSKAHIVAICLALAFWLFGLSRLSGKRNLNRRSRATANGAALLVVISILGFVLGFWSMPVTHRLVFGVVFGWTALSSLELLKSKSN